MSEYRQCSLCGRKGTRSFITLSETGPPVCKHKATCDRRRQAWLNSFKPPRRREGAEAS
jgi:hypothetical protein